MRIVLLGHPEVYSNVALGLLIEALAGHELRLLLSVPVTGGTDPAPALADLERVERGWCAELSSRPADGPVLDFGRLAARTGHPLGSLPRPNSPEGLALLAEHEPDLLISIRYRKILKDVAIAIPRHGVLNLHSGLLPQYRGTMATFWAMLADESKIGSTLHYIVDGSIDTGPLVGTAARPLDYGASYAANVLSLYPSGCAMVTRAVASIERDGAAPSVPQPGRGRYYSYPQAADFERFFARGHRLYDRGDLDRFIARSLGRRKS